VRTAGQGARTGVLVQPAGGGQFGSWVENAGDDQSADQVALGAAGARQQRVQTEAAERAEGGGGAVRKGALDLERRGGEELLALEEAVEEIDLSRGASGRG